MIIIVHLGSSLSTTAIVIIAVVITLLLSIVITTVTIIVMVKVYVKCTSPNITVAVTAPVGNDNMADVERLENHLYPHNGAATGSSNTAVYDYVMNVHTQKNPNDVDMQKNPSYHTAAFT